MATGRRLQTIRVLILLAMVLVLALSSFSFWQPAVQTGEGKDSLNAGQGLRPDSLQINLTENIQRPSPLAGNVVYKFFGGPRCFLRTAVLIPYILCFTWMYVSASRAKKPLSVIAVPGGGHSPPPVSA